jgi:uncharacterized protein (TIGR02284 family)
MATNDNLITVLNDLIRINNDRIVGYEKAADEARDIDVDLRAIFSRMSEESRQYAAELTQEVVKLGVILQQEQPIQEKYTVSGWM